MKKILIIHHGVGVGGALISLLGLIEQLKKEYIVEVYCIFNSEAVSYIKRCDVKVLTPKHKFYKSAYLIFTHSEASFFSLASLKRQVFAVSSFILSNYFFAKKELEVIAADCDLVYLNSVFLSDWSRAAKKLNKKVVMHVREPLAQGILGVRRWLIRRNIDRYIDQIIAITEDNQRRVGFPDKTQVVYNPIVKIENNGMSISVDKRFKHFLYLGGFARIKGIEQLVDSLKYLDEEVRIFVLGGLPQETKGYKSVLRFLLDPFSCKIARFHRLLKESTNVIIVGFSDNVFEYYNNSLALICPFAKPHAARPVLEAFSVGKPVIASDIEGMDELISEKNGLLFQNNSGKVLAKKINELSKMPVERYDELCIGAVDAYRRIYENNGSVLEAIKGLGY